MRIKSVKAIPLYVSFADMWGGADKVPPSVLRPAAHFRRIPRSGQYSTIVVVEETGGALGLGEAFGRVHDGGLCCDCEGGWVA